MDDISTPSRMSEPDNRSNENTGTFTPTCQVHVEDMMEDMMEDMVKDKVKDVAEVNKDDMVEGVYLSIPSKHINRFNCQATNDLKWVL